MSEGPRKYSGPASIQRWMRNASSSARSESNSQAQVAAPAQENPPQPAQPSNASQALPQQEMTDKELQKFGRLLSRLRPRLPQIKFDKNSMQYWHEDDSEVF